MTPSSHKHGLSPVTIPLDLSRKLEQRFWAVSADAEPDMDRLRQNMAKVFASSDKLYIVVAGHLPKNDNSAISEGKTLSQL